MVMTAVIKYNNLRIKMRNTSFAHKPSEENFLGSQVLHNVLSFSPLSVK